MTKRPAGPPGGRGRKGSAGREDLSGPGAARAPGRPSGGTSSRSPGGPAARRQGRPARSGAVPPPRGSAKGAPRPPQGGTRTATRPAARPAPPRRPPRPRVPFRRRDPMKRLNVTLLAIAFVLSLFAGRLVQLQTIESGQYSEEARKQRLREITLPAVRGDITDAQGNALAMTVEARGVYADPSVIKPAKRQAIVDALAPMLGLEPAFVLRAVSEPKSQYEVLAHGVRPDQARLVMGLKFTGIGVEPEYRRVYPAGSLAAGVVGFVNAAGEGGAGLESSMDKLLAGRSGSQRVEISPDGQQIPMGEDQTKPSVPGRGVRLTLMRDIQYKAEQAIAKQVKATGARSGSVIVMDPRNGQLLALATAPGYDPNQYGRSNSATWGSPVVQEAYEPGSTGKVLTAAAVLEKGGVTPATPFLVRDHIVEGPRTFHDSHPHAPERLTFAGVLAKSSNVGTIMASKTITQDTLYRFLRDFGFGQKTGIGLPGETPGLLNAPSKWSGTDRYPIAFGQSVSVNAVQMASVYATIANGGVRVAPTLVAGTVSEDGAFTPAKAPASRRVVSAATARQISDMLEGVATVEGTAPKARIEGYRVAGKTGTAEIVNPSCGCYKGGGWTSSFAGFAPADDPQLVVQVVLQHPTKGSHLGGDIAAPVFKDVMTSALATRKVPPTGSKAPAVQIYARD
ncbi:peptidoglycan D,D-transpeptidase FtsI family protein [Actinomadura parmotrematis]|uniref:Penicillin-binding protein 2 n=1 Tax=Actinomadura parmotrematis TaxID=2864039 RepID=A0ABS7FMM2_9ACTN|nr:penicillin-binding protein 2 [Actinomadura parmotrematis]MBW8481014.1 penicillin-binding protein 2 [Actinomadura parmotrematis]